MKLSVVTPSFNQARFIERTLQSVAMQDGVDLEHLVYDGGSDDGTVDLLRRAGPALRWVSRKDGGQADAVNQAIAACDGDIIGWLNSDDVYYAGAAARVVAFFDAHPDIDVVYGDADHIDVVDHPFERYPTEPWDFERLQSFCYICQPALFLRRRVVDAHGALDASLAYCMDYEYWLRLGKAGVRFAYLPERLAGSRLYADNKTLGARVAVHREINDMCRRTLGRVPDRWLFNYAHAVVEARTGGRRARGLFAIRVALAALSSALRWNGRIAPSMIATLWSGVWRSATVRR